MYSKLIITIILFIALFIVFILWQLYAYNAPQPKYRLIKSDNGIEIREYPELIVAEVKVSGERYASINQGFRLLAGFIFGKNKRKQSIAMTAPVRQEKSKDGWIIRFIMPAEFSMSSLPAPDNQAISFSQMKSKKYIVIRFSGFNSDKNIQSHTKTLLDYINKNHINTVGEPIMAFYNPPWILPFLRRNEIMIEMRG